MTTLTGVKQDQVGQQYDIAVGYSPDGINCTMVGYILPPTGKWAQTNQLNEQGQLVAVASPNQVDRDLQIFPKVSQGDWSGGERQVTFEDPKRYYIAGGMIDITKPQGLTLLFSGQAATIPGGFTVPDYAPMASDGLNVAIGGTSGGAPALVTYTSGTGGTVNAITGATGSVAALEQFSGWFYTVTGNGIWRSDAFGASVSQITSDVPAACEQPLAFFDGTLYYVDSTQRNLKSAASSLGNVAGTQTWAVPALEGPIQAITADSLGVVIATATISLPGSAAAEWGETTLHRFDGTPTTHIGKIYGTVRRMHTCQGITYILAAANVGGAVIGGAPYILYALEGSTISQIDDSRYLLPDFQGGGSRTFSAGWHAHLWDDGRFVYIGWPALRGLRYDITSGAISGWGGAAVNQGGPGSSNVAHRIVNGYEINVGHSSISGHPQVVTLTAWTGAATSDTITTSDYDFSTPAVAKVFRQSDLQLAAPLPTGAALQVQYQLDNQTAWSAAMTLVATGTGGFDFSAFFPANTKGKRVRFLITLTAGSGGAPTIRSCSVTAGLPRRWTIDLWCARNLTLRDGQQDSQGDGAIDLLGNLMNALANHTVILFVPSPLAPSTSPSRTEQVNATFESYEWGTESGSSPTYRPGGDQTTRDMEGVVTCTFVETI